MNTTDSAVRLTHESHGHRGDLPEREEPAAEQGGRLPRAARQASYELEERKRAEELDELRGERMDNSLRQPDSQLRALPVPAREGSPKRR